MKISTMECPVCPSWMILRQTNRLLMTNPPHVEMEWWCGCGYVKPANPSPLLVLDDPSYEWWLTANGQRDYEERQAKRRAKLPWWRRMFS